MATEKIAISKQYLLKAYREAEPSQKEFMKQLFGSDTFASSVMERVKTFDDAYNELGSEHPFCKTLDLFIKTNVNNDISNIADVLAYLKLRIIAAALNEGWQPKFTKDEWRYYPYFYVLTKEEYEHLKDYAKGRCVGRSSNNANADGGLVYAYTNNGSANSNTIGGVRLAFTGELENESEIDPTQSETA